MKKPGELVSIGRFRALRNRGDAHVNHLRDECLAAAERLRQDLKAHHRCRRWPLVAIACWSVITVTAVAVLYWFWEDLDTVATLVASVVSAAIVAGMTFNAYVIDSRRLNSQLTLKAVANLTADVISRARAPHRPKRGTSLAADQALNAAYDDALAEMRRAVVVLGPTYLWKDPALVEMNETLEAPARRAPPPRPRFSPDDSP